MENERQTRKTKAQIRYEEAKDRDAEFYKHERMLEISYVVMGKNTESGFPMFMKSNGDWVDGLEGSCRFVNYEDCYNWLLQTWPKANRIRCPRYSITICKIFVYYEYHNMNLHSDLEKVDGGKPEWWK